MNKNKIMILISMIFAISANAGMETKTYDGTDNWGDRCSLEILSVESEGQNLAEHRVQVRINYIETTLTLRHPFEVIWGIPIVTGKVYSNRYVPSGGTVSISPESPDTFLTVPVNEEHQPTSFTYFDNSGKGFKRRSFDCHFEIKDP